MKDKQPKVTPEDIAKYTRWCESAESSRKEIDWKWFQYDLWVGGYHYAKWDKSTKQIISVSDDGKPKVIINKIYSTLRAVRNYAVRNRPRAEVVPNSDDPEVISGALNQNKFLDFMHDDLKLRKKLKSTVWDALKYSVGYWQVLWDEDENDGQGEIVVNEIDPYDLYWDPRARFKEEAKYCVVEVRRNVEDLKNDSKYNKEETAKIKGDKRLAASSLKERFVRFEMGDTSVRDEEGTVIVKELWHIEEKDNKKTVWITVLADNRVIRNEETDLKILPIFVLPCDINPRSFYGQGWVKNLISPNKELNRTLSQVAEWNHIMNVGKWISDKGAGVRIINNNNGQIIEKKRGYEVKQAAISPISPISFSLKESWDTYLEDLGGFHEASMGRIPSGARSGAAVEALQTGDANNMSEIVENIEEFLEDVYEYILTLAAQKYQFARSITPTSALGQREYLKVIGEEAPEDAKIDGATILPSKATVDVKITSWLAQSTEARQEKAKELFGLGAIDEQTLLEFFEVGNIAEVLVRLKEKKEKEQEQQMQMQTQMAQTQKDMNAVDSPISGTQQAIAAIRSILMGEQPVLPNEATPEFLDYIDNFLESEQSISPEERSVIQKFRDQVAQTAGRQNIKK